MQERKETLAITIEEAAEYIGVGKDCVKRMTEVPDFPLFRVGNRTPIIKPKILDWLIKHNREDFGKWGEYLQSLQTLLDTFTREKLLNISFS